MSQQQKQLILSALKQTLNRNKTPSNHYQVSFLPNNYSQKPSYKLQKRKAYHNYFIEQQKAKEDTLSTGVQLMVDNTTLLLQNLAKLIALNTQHYQDRLK